MNFLKTRPKTQANRNAENSGLNAARWGHRGTTQFVSNIESSEEDQDDTDNMEDWDMTISHNKHIEPDSSEEDIKVTLSRKQTVLLATLVPDEVLTSETFETLSPKYFVGVLLMADVSGFTALSERYGSAGKGGTYRLTVTLNTYLGGLLEIIYSHGGDVIKFAGDAFLALWKTDKKSFLSHTIHTVITCALVIQRSFSSYETDVKVNLKVKLAISAGNLIFTPIGSGIDMNYVIFGLPVIEAKLAESVCASGEVKLTPTAWGHCYTRNYIHQIHDDGHVTIISILYDPRETDVNKPFQGLGSLIKPVKKVLQGIEHLPNHMWEPPENLIEADILKKREALSLRKSILIAEERNIGSELRRFMIRSVLTQIDAHQPLEYLTEMRHVSILFITLKPKECSYVQLLTIVNNSYQISCEIVYTAMGCVNKIILFDKDVMILVIFGLRGFKHDSEAQEALKCAYSIKKSISALDGVLEVSIGVTTGNVYCGVVGHPLRREFTVIGAIVNKAARLMCYFRNKVTCDETTFMTSKMSSNGFTLQPKIDMKGIADSGKIYEYTEEIRIKELYDIPIVAPLLNREEELCFFQNWILNRIPRDINAILLTGESRIGKTRLLEWMKREVPQCIDYKSCYVNLTSIHSATPYLAVTQIMTQILGLTEPIAQFDKEEKIVQYLKLYDDDLCYLNKIIQVRFAYHEGIYSLTEDQRKEKAKAMLIKVIQSLPGKYVIFLDNLMNIDQESWSFISIMMTVNKIFPIMTVSRQKMVSQNFWLYSVLNNNNIKKMMLRPLNVMWTPALACQILNVEAVSLDLCNALKTKCKGMPGLVESLLLHLFTTGAIEITKVENETLLDYADEELQFLEKSILHPQALNAADQSKLDELMQENYEEETNICIVRDKALLNKNFNVQKNDTMIMIEIDSLTPYQQLLLKIASVIGNAFSRVLLENIMYENNPLTTTKAIKRFFVMKILTCASLKSTKTDNNNSTKEPMCDCPLDLDIESNENLPKYAYCKIMRFKNKTTRNTCYELLPINQKKDFHTRVVNYLEKVDHKCSECGGAVMVVPPTIYEDESSDEEGNSSVDKTNISDESISDEYDVDFQTQPRTTLVERETSVNRRKSSSDLHRGSVLLHNTESERGIRRNFSSFNRRSTRRITLPSIIFKKTLATAPAQQEGERLIDKLRSFLEAPTINVWHNLGIIDSQDNLSDEKCSFSIALEKGASSTNFYTCTCKELNVMICEQLVYHARQAEMKLRVIEFIIKCSYMYLMINRLENVLSNLREAEDLLQEKDIRDTLKNRERKRLLGMIYSLRAAACMMDGRYTSAKYEIERAMRIYKINLHKMTAIFRVIANIRKTTKYRIQSDNMKKESIFFLNVTTLVYFSLGDAITSRIAALRALETIREVNCDIIDLCDALNNALQTEMRRGIYETTRDIEISVKKAFKAVKEPVKAQELFVFGKLFTTLYRSRMARGRIAPAIRAAYRALVISRFLHADHVSMEIIPDLFYILLAKGRLAEAVNVAIELLRINPKRSNMDPETWYYALCMDMILDAGCELESPQEITRFADYILNRNKTEFSGFRRLVTGVWIYWMRAQSDRKAKRFEGAALYYTGWTNDDSLMSTLISSMRLAEGMNESLSRKIDELKKVVDLMEMRSLADRELSRVEESARKCKTVYPRLLLLKALSLELSGRQANLTSLYNQALEEARKIHNRLEEALVRSAMTKTTQWKQRAHTHSFQCWEDVTAAQIKEQWHVMLYSTAKNEKNSVLGISKKRH